MFGDSNDETNMKTKKSVVRGGASGYWRRHFDGQVSRRLKEVMSF